MIIYILQVEMIQKKYSVIDLQGSLSRNIMDSMLFFNEFSAESYAGPIEHLIEEKIQTVATVNVVKMPLSSVIPKTTLECVPCP